MSWFSLSFLAMISFSLMTFCIVTLTRKGIPVNFVLLFTALGVFAFFTLLTWKLHNFPAHTEVSTIIVVSLIILLSALGNWAQFSATNNAPNPGLVIAIVSMQSGVLAIISWIFLKSKMNPIQIIGLIIVIAGVATIGIGSGINKKPNDDIKPNAISEGS
jgi:drug/metabolite transporter (DMT)-like permease